MLGLFRRLSQAEKDKTAAIKLMVRDIFNIDEETIISVNEIQCADPSCPGNETVILIMQPGKKTRAGKIPAPLMDVNRNAIEKALFQ